MSFRALIVLLCVLGAAVPTGSARAGLLMELALENLAQCKRLCETNESCTRYRFRRPTCEIHEGADCADCRALPKAEISRRDAAVGKDRRGNNLDDVEVDPNQGARGICSYVRRTTSGAYDQADPNYCACVGAGDPACPGNAR